LREDRPVGIRCVLVVGAGIAGSTIAYFLARSGITATIVERMGEQRSSGSPVDVRGPALAVVDQMNVLAPIRAAATQVTRLAAVDSRGRAIGWIPTQTGPDAIEIPRSEPAAILASAGSEHAEFLYDDTVTAVREDDDGVEVTFERAAPRRFDLVVGADGLHSTVRRLIFGPEEQFTTHLGLYIATVDLDRASSDPHTVLIHNAPGRAVFIHPTTGREGAAFIFRHSLLTADEGTDLWKQKQLLTVTYEGMGWRVPELLDHVRDSDDLYFDSVTRVRLDRWSHGRVVLIGDAADCVSLLGEGSSMAIVGAAALAQHLAVQPTDTRAALRHYEQVHRRRLRPHHGGASIAGHLLVPETRAGITVRDAVFRTCATAAATHKRIR
jgi:2-polyprenyl-6-methoxyphenol hydroxylase-like FAD-dependent oxidoreductase